MLSLKPLPYEEYPNRAKLINAALDQAEGSDHLTSESVFGVSKYGRDEDRPLQQYHMRGYIDISDTPILNEIIAGTKGGTLATILGMAPADMEAILHFDKVMVEGEMVRAEEAGDSLLDNCRLGPQIVSDLIDNFNIHNALEGELDCVVAEFIKYAKLKVSGDFGKIDHDNCGLPIIGDYYWHVPPYYADLSEKWYEFLADRVFNTSTCRLTYLYALDKPDGKARLQSCILRRIMVTPLNTRPAAGITRYDPLTKDYAVVFNKHQYLSFAISGYGAVASAISAYQDFISSCHALIVEHAHYQGNHKAILERIKGKKGHVRDKMLGKRVDFSGRSVITIDPFMSIRNIGIPRDMLPKLYRSQILRSLPKQNRDVSAYIGTTAQKSARCLDRIESADLLNKVKVITGRQPTLHKPSMRSFTAKAVPGRSIQLNPLCVIGFNADFDGDQMYVRVPTTAEGIKEANELMSIEQNLFLPKNGECSVMPRQEIIYGLNVCTRTGMKPAGNGGGFSYFRDLVQAIRAQKISIDTKVTCMGEAGCAGRVAFMCCWNRRAFTEVEWDELRALEVTSSSIKKYVNKLAAYSADVAIDCIDNMTLLGFTVAGVYPPTLNLLGDDDISYAPLMKNFHEAIAEDTKYYNMGWESEEEYDTNYTEAFESEVDKKVKGSIGKDASGASISMVENDAGLENGFVRMSRSGARGSSSNLLQLYGYKGRVQDGTHGGSFRAVIEHSYATQLTPLEHFITAYGGRAGLIQKSLSTADSGYLMRKLWHTTSPFTITNDDCGSTEGLTVSVVAIQRVIGCNSTEARDIFVDMITGRYLAQEVDKYPAGTLVTRDIAVAISKSDNARANIRSVLTCKNPCCKKCYGIDLSTNKMAAKGLPIGFIAAQSIGEPGTQLNMDAFKKGGVASSSSSTRLSGFKKLSIYVSMTDKFSSVVQSYDPVAWADGYIHESPNPNGTKKVSIEGAKGSITLPINVILRTGEEVHRGEGMRKLAGDQDVREIVEYDSLLHAQRYLCFALYDVYRNEGAVNLKHFEVLALAMTMSMVLTTDQPSLTPGAWHDQIQMFKCDLSNTAHFERLHAISSVPLERPIALSRIAMEHMRDGLSSSVLLGLKDPLDYPLNRILMGLKPWTNPAINDGTFMTQRRI